jgi:hypothetical protein
MRKSIFILHFASVLPLLSGTASAETIRQFKANVSAVRAACSAAGGTFGVHIDGGGYGCDTKKGQVHCDNQSNCVGVTPRSAGSLPNTLAGILGIVETGSSSSSDTPAQSAISGNSAPVVEDKPVRDPVTPPDGNVTGNGGLPGGGLGQ